jgi:hypothetical protein
MNAMRFWGVLLGVAIGLCASAQTVSDCFIRMPERLLPGISVDTRKDLVDFYKNGNAAIMPAAFGGKVELRALTDTYLLLKTSENADLQLALLNPSSTTPIVAVVRTAKAPLEDSRAAFYTLDWKPFSGMSLPILTPLHFVDTLKVAAKGYTSRLQELGPRLFVKWTVQGDRWLAQSSLARDLSLDARDTWKGMIRDTLTFRWDGVKLLPQP